MSRGLDQWIFPLHREPSLWHYDSAIKISSPNCWDEKSCRAIGKSSLELSNLDNQLASTVMHAEGTAAKNNGHKGIRVPILVVKTGQSKATFIFQLFLLFFAGKIQRRYGFFGLPKL